MKNLIVRLIEDDCDFLDIVSLKHADDSEYNRCHVSVEFVLDKLDEVLMRTVIVV